MDPLSLLASITGILAVAAKVTSILTELIRNEKDAPSSISNIVAEVSDLRACLAQLSPLIRGVGSVPRSQRAAVSVDQVIIISTSCVLTMSELERILDSFKFDQPMSTVSKIRWSRQEQKIAGILTRVRASKSSLNLILTILSW